MVCEPVNRVTFVYLIFEFVIEKRGQRKVMSSLAVAWAYIDLLQKRCEKIGCF